MTRSLSKCCLIFCSLDRKLSSFQWYSSAMRLTKRLTWQTWSRLHQKIGLLYRITPGYYYRLVWAQSESFQGASSSRTRSGKQDSSAMSCQNIQWYSGPLMEMNNLRKRCWELQDPYFGSVIAIPEALPCKQEEPLHIVPKLNLAWHRATISFRITSPKIDPFSWRATHHITCAGMNLSWSWFQWNWCVNKNSRKWFAHRWLHVSNAS